MSDILKGVDGHFDPTGTDQHAPGAKMDGGKPLAGLLLDFGLALEAVAELGTFGAKKYSRGGWQSVPDGIQRYEDAMMRHMLRVRTEKIDPETNLPHLYAVAWNSLALLELAIRERDESRTGESQ